MKDAHVEAEQLHRYFDGELAAGPANEVAAHVERCEVCAAELRGLRQLRRLVTLAAEEGGREVDFGALFARIERDVKSQPRAGLMERVAFGMRQSSRTQQIFVPVAAAALAAAAAVLLFVRPGVQPPVEQGRPSQPEARISTPVPPSEPNSEVEQVDFGEKTGTVFEVALADGVSTEVVWIDDDEQGRE